MNAQAKLPADWRPLNNNLSRGHGFEPLRVLPAGKKIVLGLVTTKLGELESADALERQMGRELERLGFYWYEHPMPAVAHPALPPAQG